MVPIYIGTQNAWPGGPLYVLDASGKLGRQLGGADCTSASITAQGLIPCLSRQYRDTVTVRDSTGSVLWTPAVDGFSALALRMAADGQAISDHAKVATRSAGLVSLPQGFWVEGWLDGDTVFGRLPGDREFGNLAWISLSSPLVVHDLGFKGDFVAPLPRQAGR